MLHRGTVYIEARLRETVLDDAAGDPLQIQQMLEQQLSKEGASFFLLEDIMSNRRAEHLLGAFYAWAKANLQSLRVAEYQGLAQGEPCYSARDVQVKVQVYELYTDCSSRVFGGDGEITQLECTNLPHIKFDNIWDDLIFEEDFKEDLIWMMTNIRSRGTCQGAMIPLILLHGPPGTGKTSLCQGLAQKISIRLGVAYTRAKLLQLGTASLFSKYYSESAKQVEAIFAQIEAMCQKDAGMFVCVLIDEIESIASSREFSTETGESLDTMRATNALLTGLDRTKAYPNVVFLCTSNLLDSLDSAFLDRCGAKLAINPPTLPSRYAIMRGILQKLIDRGVIKSTEILPAYREAELQSHSNMDFPAAKLLDIVKRISSDRISGRALTYLPEHAILRYLREEDCDLGMALKFIEKVAMQQGVLQ